MGLIDVDALAAAEGEDWVWRGGATLPGTLDRAIIHLSRGAASHARSVSRLKAVQMAGS